uniref:Transmembrane protein n=1 Tax=Neobodo designis TaxID=312471 RepID=A0A7S1QID9_NEODS|mmetsp:Transcript_46136/g.142155  ORF Transcript_46136/g.142155 Transcript_46136/m.142155 type:complete len:319 (+) Transcript_46136:79-1035(+)|eukprot:CAMPEP_0174843580 /NCGR_PEP_ID=MMETSP1114-20130205/10613_1 /TAXON_ID=312471 /ORGANISM="Neobodo designis, Strain CCAP 1951/1" /LENGTH=318 /DNA_ID=CAMNT_0016077805 /DNA_START=77 /DNA_END=1033 /DNA_ORIENTATION=+
MESPPTQPQGSDGEELVTIGAGREAEAAAIRKANLELAQQAKAEADEAYASEFKCRVATGALFFGLFFAFCGVVSWWHWPAMEANAVRATTTLNGYLGKICVTPIGVNVGNIQDNCDILAPANTTAERTKMDNGDCCVSAADYQPFVYQRTVTSVRFRNRFASVHAAFVAFAAASCIEAALVVTFPLHHLVTAGKLITPAAATARVAHLALLVLAHVVAFASAWAAYALEQSLVTDKESSIYVPHGGAEYTAADLGFEIPKDGRLIEAVGYTVTPIVLALTLYLFRRIQATGHVEHETDVPKVAAADDNTEVLLVNAA